MKWMHKWFFVENSWSAAVFCLKTSVFTHLSSAYPCKLVNKPNPLQWWHNNEHLIACSTNHTSAHQGTLVHHFVQSSLHPRALEHIHKIFQRCHKPNNILLGNHRFETALVWDNTPLKRALHIYCCSVTKSSMPFMLWHTKLHNGIITDCNLWCSAFS